MSKKRSKPGPEPDRLKIDGDPGEALDRLLRTPPPPKKKADRRRKKGDGKAKP